MSVVALVGAALSIAKPRMAAGLMLLSAIVGVIAVSAFYAIAGVLLLIAASLAFQGRRKPKELGVPMSPPVPHSFCSNCGFGLGTQAKFCSRCGSEA